MSSDLKQLIAQTQSTFAADPSAAKTTFSSSSTLRDGLHSEVAIRHHHVDVDEPEALGGADSGPSSSSSPPWAAVKRSLTAPTRPPSAFRLTTSR